MAENRLNFIFDGDNSGFTQALQQVQAKLTDVGNKMKEFGSTMSTYVSLPLAALGAASIKAFGDIQSLKNGLTAVTGSAEETNKQFVRLKELAKLPGLGLQEVTKGSINLQVIGFSAEKAEKSIKAFGNAVATVGGGREQFERATYGLAQLANTDFPLGEDLNIIKDAIPQVTPLLKEAFGSARSDDLKELGITSGQVVDTIVNGLSKLPPVTGGVNAAFENLKDGVFTNLAEVGEIINKNLDISALSDKIVAGITSVTEWFKSLSPEIQKATLVFAGLAIVIPPIIAGLGVFISTILPALMTGFAALASPITLVVAAISGAVYAIIANWDEIKAYFTSGEGSTFWDSIVSYASDLWESLKSIFNEIKNVIVGVWNTIGSNVIGYVKGAFGIIQGIISTVLGVISGYFKVFSSVIRGDWSGAWEGIKTITASIWNGLLQVVQGGLTMLNNALGAFFKAIGADKMAHGFEYVNKRIASIFQKLQIPVKKATESFKDFNKEVAKASNISPTTKPKNTSSTTKGDDNKDIAEVYKDLAVKLKQIELEFGATFDEKAQSKIKAYQQAINDLVKNGVSPLSDSIKKLQELQQSNNLLQLPKDYNNSVTSKNSKSPEAKVALPKVATVQFSKDTQAVIKMAQDFNRDFNQSLNNGLAGGISDAFGAIGEAMANGGNVFEAMGKAILGSFGKFLSQFGDMLIQYGTAALLKAKLDLAIAIPGAGLVVAGLAIAAGAALKAIGSAFSGLVSGNKNGGGSPRPFAKGGIVSSPTNAIFGEYPSAGRGNPEVVAPLNSLKGMLGDIGGNNGGEVLFTIKADTLVGVLNNYDKRRLRTG